MLRKAVGQTSAWPLFEALEPRTLLSALSIGNLVLPEGNSGQKDFDFTVSLSEAAPQDVTVHYRTADGSAVAGQDYVGVTDEVVTIPAGQLLGTARVEVIGDVTFESFETFSVQLFNPEGASITGGQATGAILNDDRVAGPLVAWGSDLQHQLQVPTGNDFVAIDASDTRGIALKADGSIVAWGEDVIGDGTPPAGNDFVGIAAGYTHYLALKADGSLATWGGGGGSADPLPPGNDFTAIAAGAAFNVFLKADGSLVGRWRNAYHDLDLGQIDVPAGNDYVAIAAGLHFGAALRSDGSLAAWGSDAYGLSNPPAGHDFVAVAAGATHGLALKSDGSLVAWGWDGNTDGQTNIPAGNDFVAIAARGLNSVALRADGTVAAWGDDELGQLNNVPTSNTFGTIATGGPFGLAIEKYILTMTLALPGPDAVFTETQPPIVIDPAATLTNPNVPDFGGGVLTVGLTADAAPEDRLAISNQGSGPGQIGISGQTVTYEGVPIGTFTGGTSGSLPLKVTFNADTTVVAIEALLRAITFQNVSGSMSPLPRTAKFSVTDGHGGTSNLATKTIAMVAVNDPPVITAPAAQTTDEDADLVFSAAALNGISVADVDAGAAPIKVTLTATHGVLILGSTADLDSVTGNGTGTVTFIGTLDHINTALDGLAFGPAADYSGGATLQIDVDDQGDVPGLPAQTDSRTVALAIDPVNDKPAANPQDAIAGEHAPAVIALTGSDLETPAGQLTYAISQQPQHGAVVLDGSQATYTPAGHYNGPDSFTFTVTDNGDPAGSHAHPGDRTSDPATVSITVTPVNDAPAAQGQAVVTLERTAVEITLVGTDLETPADQLVYTPADPQHGTLTPLGGAHFLYTPAGSYWGPDSFTFTVTDNGDPAGGHANPGDLTSDPAAVTITIGPVNNSPVAQDQPVVASQHTPVDITLVGTDQETAADQLIYTPTDPQHGTLAPLGGARFRYVPTGDYWGPDSFTFTVTDNGDPAGSHDNPGDLTGAPATVSITVNPINAVPMADSQSVETLQHTPREIVLSGTDAETPDQLTYTPAAPQHGTLTPLGGAHFLYTPTGGYWGPDSFTFTVTDAGWPVGTNPVTSAPATVDIAVNRIGNTPPVALGQSVTTTMNTTSVTNPVDITLVGSDKETTDPTQLTYTPTDPQHGTLTPLGGANFRYYPAPDYWGPDSFTFTVTDLPPTPGADPATSSPATVDILVCPFQHMTSGGKVQFIDAGSHLVTVSLKGPGSADLLFATKLEPHDLMAILLTGTTAASSLTITTPAGVVANIGRLIKVTGSLGSIAAASTHLGGDLNVSGTLDALVLNSMTGPATIRLGGAADAKNSTKMTLGQVADVSIDSRMPIASIAAKEWREIDGLPDTLSAPRLGALTISGDAKLKLAGDFAAGLTLSGAGLTGTAKTLGGVTIKGAVAPSTWDVTGTAGALVIVGSVGAAGQPWVLKHATSVASLTLGDVVDADVSAGVLGAVKAVRWQAGSITGNLLTSIATTGLAATTLNPAVPGDFGADLTLSGAGLTGTAKTLGGAAIKGNVSGSTWDVTGVTGSLALRGTVGAAGQPWVLKHATSVASLALGDVVEADVSAGVLGAIKAVRWQAGSITGNLLTSIATTGLAATTLKPAIPGDFGADLTLTGVGVLAKGKTLGGATIKGAVAPSTWDVTGTAGALAATGAVGAAGLPWVLKNSGVVASLTLGDVIDAEVQGAATLGAVKAVRWQAGKITGNTVASIATVGAAATKTAAAIRGDFAADLALAGVGVTAKTKTLGSVSIKGNVAGSLWDVKGPVGGIVLAGLAGEAAKPWQLTGVTNGVAVTNVASLTAYDVVNAALTVDGDIGAVKAKRWQAGSLHAKTVASIATTGVAPSTANPAGVSGDFKANVTLTDAVRKTLGTMTVAGWLADATITSAGPLGALTVGAASNATVLAGDLTVQKTSIAGFSVKGIKGETFAFISSNVRAWALGTVVVTAVNGDNGGAIFGFKCHSITSYTRDGVKYSKPGTPAAEDKVDPDYLLDLVP
jgi:hypothetical protein